MRFERLMAGLLIFAFVFTQILPSPSYAAFNLSDSSNSAQTFENGTFKDSFAGSSGREVILIQDAHSDEGTQLAISNLLGEITSREKIDFVALEGAWTSLKPDALRFVHDRKKNREILLYILKHGEISGAELFATETKRAIPFEGVEEASLYRKYFLILQDILKGRTPSETFSKNLRQELMDRAAKELNPKLRDLIRNQEAYQGGNLDVLPFLDSLRKLYRQISNSELAAPRNQLAYPNMLRILALKETAKNLDLNKVTSEFKSWKNDLDAYGISKPFDSDLASITREIQGQKSTRKTTLRDLLEGIWDESYSKGRPFSISENLKTYFQFHLLEEELTGEKLFEEIDGLTENLADQLAQTEEERAFLKDWRDSKLLGRLLKAELTKENWEQIKTPDSRLQTLEKKAGVWGLGSIVSDALQFYRGTELRDQEMTKNLAGLFEKHHAKKAILITGGFHAESIKAILKTQGFGYREIMPVRKSKEEDTFSQLAGKITLTHYQEAILNRSIPLPQVATLAEVVKQMGWKALMQAGFHEDAYVTGELALEAARNQVRWDRHGDSITIPPEFFQAEFVKNLQELQPSGNGNSLGAVITPDKLGSLPFYGFDRFKEGRTSEKTIGERYRDPNALAKLADIFDKNNGEQPAAMFEWTGNNRNGQRDHRTAMVLTKGSLLKIEKWQAGSQGEMEFDFVRETTVGPGTGKGTTPQELEAQFWAWVNAQGKSLGAETRPKSKPSLRVVKVPETTPDEVGALSLFRVVKGVRKYPKFPRVRQNGFLREHLDRLAYLLKKSGKASEVEGMYLVLYDGKSEVGFVFSSGAIPIKIRADKKMVKLTLGEPYTKREIVSRGYSPQSRAQNILEEKVRIQKKGADEAAAKAKADAKVKEMLKAKRGKTSRNGKSLGLPFNTMDQIKDFYDKTVLLRVNLKVAAEGGQIKDFDHPHPRVKEAAKIILELVRKKARVIVVFDQGRPGAKDFIDDPSQHAAQLQLAFRQLAREKGSTITEEEIIRKYPITPLDDLFGEKVVKTIENVMSPGHILVLKPLRAVDPADPERKRYLRDNPNFVNILENEINYVVMDNFFVSHRNDPLFHFKKEPDASLFMFKGALAGPSFVREYQKYQKAMELFDSAQPHLEIIGGKKVSEKFLILESALTSRASQVQKVLLGGRLGLLAWVAKDPRASGLKAEDQTGLEALAKEVLGAKTIEDMVADDEETLSYIPRLAELLKQNPEKVELPTDLVYLDANEKVRFAKVDHLTQGSFREKDTTLFAGIGYETSEDYVYWARKDFKSALAIGPLIDSRQEALTRLAAAPLIAVSRNPNIVSWMTGGDDTKSVVHSARRDHDLGSKPSYHFPVVGALANLLAGKELPGIQFLIQNRPSQGEVKAPQQASSLGTQALSEIVRRITNHSLAAVLAIALVVGQGFINPKLAYAAPQIVQTLEEESGQANLAASSGDLSKIRTSTELAGKLFSALDSIRETRPSFNLITSDQLSTESIELLELLHQRNRGEYTVVYDLGQDNRLTEKLAQKFGKDNVRFRIVDARGLDAKGLAETISRTLRSKKIESFAKRFAKLDKKSDLNRRITVNAPQAVLAQLSQFPELNLVDAITEDSSFREAKTREQQAALLIERAASHLLAYAGGNLTHLQQSLGLGGIIIVKEAPNGLARTYRIPWSNIAAALKDVLTSWRTSLEIAHSA